MSSSSDSLRRCEPYAGIAYVVFFLASMAASNPPADNASNQKWIQSYADRGEQIHHLATGLLLLLAGLSLMTFLVALWRRVAAAHPAEPSRLPVAAAGAAAALIGAGGMVMAYISGGELLGHYPLPGVGLLRMSNDLGFALAGVAGSWAAGVAVATLSIQGYTAGVFGARMRAFGVLTAFSLLLAMLFVPIAVLFLWVLTAAVMWIRRPELAGRRTMAVAQVGGSGA